MKLLQDKILSDADIKPGGVVIVSNFLNHRMDISLIDEMGKEFYRLFKDTMPTLILTIEASCIIRPCSRRAESKSAPFATSRANTKSTLKSP